jgi:hypothetical protein
MNQPILMLQTLLLQLTGELRELSMLSKIKHNVDHAGLSQPLLQLKELIKSKLELFFHFQNNNLLIVINYQLDVTEDGNHTPSDMLNFTHKTLKMIMYTLL